MRAILIIVAAILIFAPALLQSEAATPAVEAVPAKATTVASDALLQQKIQEKFAKAKAGGGKFTVKVTQGTAYLSGRAEVSQHKGAATRMAKAAGAKRIVNNIVVSESARQKARAAAVRAAS